jgi:hypothetical protein
MAKTPNPPPDLYDDPVLQLLNDMQAMYSKEKQITPQAPNKMTPREK